MYFGSASRSYAQTKGSGLDAGSTPAYTVSGLSSGRTYYFAVTAYDSNGNESEYSAEVSKLVQ